MAKKLGKGESAALALYDRVAFASDVLLFRSKKLIVDGSPDQPDAETCLAEFRAASRSAEEIELEKRMAEFERKKKEWDAQQGKKQLSVEEEEERRKEMEKMAMEMVNKEIMQLLPLTKEAKVCCDQLCREMLSFEVQMQRGTNRENAAPTVKVKIHKEGASATEKQDILIETFEFERGLATVKDEVRRMKFAIEMVAHTHHQKVTTLLHSSWIVRHTMAQPLHFPSTLVTFYQLMKVMLMSILNRAWRWIKMLDVYPLTGNHGMVRMA
jgi:hypothetical protein